MENPAHRSTALGMTPPEKASRLPGPLLPIAKSAMNHLNVALLYNLNHSSMLSPDAPPDALAEYTTQATVNAVSDALASAGHEVIQLEADLSLLDTIRRVNPDICFNMARGIDGRDRQSHVPALLEMLNIPFTGSGVLGHAIALDKAATKNAWHEAGLPVVPFQVFTSADEPIQKQIGHFPLFVKPLHEGSGMGVDADSVVLNERQMRERVGWTIEQYQQPALVETNLPGREFVVGAIGNWPGPRRTHAAASPTREANGFHLFPILEIDATGSAGQGVYSATVRAMPRGAPGAPDYHCPARLAASQADEIHRLAAAAIVAVGALDFACVNLRLGADGLPYLIEIDTLPTLDPILSNLYMMAQAEGMTYQALINEILHLAMGRYRLADSPMMLSQF